MRIVLAVSGGADSVAMLHLVHELWGLRHESETNHLIVAHYNHALRGGASDGDQVFVAAIAQNLGLTFITETASSTNPGSSEADFRAARYRFLQKTAESSGARYVFTAHTSDDNVETLLHHLFRGSGHAGLAGMATHRSLGEQVVLYRPLLHVSREHLREALSEKQLTWREDSSNANERYQRNWIRTKLLPMIRERYPHVDDALSRTIESQRQIQDRLSKDANAWVDRAIQLLGNDVYVSRGPIDLATLSAVVRLIWDQMTWPRQNMTNIHLRRLHQAITIPTDQSFSLPGDIQVITNGASICLRRNAKSIVPDNGYLNEE